MIDLRVQTVLPHEEISGPSGFLVPFIHCIFHEYTSHKMMLLHPF